MITSKQHIYALDGFRGIAAIIVVFYHIFEGFAFAGGKAVITCINHGYLAVDFFFMLSGFVIGYAYDDRLRKSIGLCDFFKRRLVRLHPLVILGVILGLVSYLIQGGVTWSGESKSFSEVLIAFLCGILLLPIIQGAGSDVRGNGEMYPLNGPSWSLFFEYIGNLLYATVIYRFGINSLKLLVILLAVSMTIFSVFDISGYGMIGVGWTLDSLNFFGGLLRMMLPFCIGLLLWRTFKPETSLFGFGTGVVILVMTFLVPYLGNIVNGIFEMAAILMIFPTVIWIGSHTYLGFRTCQVCKLLGNLSYPLYITHYPVMYLFYSWVIDTGKTTLSETWCASLLTVAVSLFLAYIAYIIYDKPVRKWLGAKI